jgi:uncharacterized glyoxalase superfamily protein PhnB
MTARFQGCPSSIIPTLRYRNVPLAIDWLCEAFGFAKHRLVGDDAGGVIYAELTLGASMIMVGPAEGSAFDHLMTQPDQIGGAETQISYLCVEDLHAHRQRAVAAGAEIVPAVEELAGTERGYSCRDPEGHIWNFGTYNPWHTLEAAGHGSRSKERTLIISSLLLLMLVAAGLLFSGPDAVHAERERAGLAWTAPKRSAGGADQPARPERAPQHAPQHAQEGAEQLARELAKMRAAKEASEQTQRALEEQLAFERNARLVTDRSVAEVQVAQVAQGAQGAQGAKNTVVASISSNPAAGSSGGLERERALRQAAETNVREMREQLQEARDARAVAERTLDDVKGQLAKAHADRLAVTERPLPERAHKETARKGSGVPTRLAAYRAARAAARARIKRWREANEPFIKPPLPTF